MESKAIISQQAILDVQKETKIHMKIHNWRGVTSEKETSHYQTIIPTTISMKTIEKGIKCLRIREVLVRIEMLFTGKPGTKIILHPNLPLPFQRFISSPKISNKLKTGLMKVSSLSNISNSNK